MGTSQFSNFKNNDFSTEQDFSSNHEIVGILQKKIKQLNATIIDKQQQLEDIKIKIKDFQANFDLQKQNFKSKNISFVETKTLLNNPLQKLIIRRQRLKNNIEELELKRV